MEKDVILGHVSQLTEKPWNYKIVYEETLDNLRGVEAKFVTTPMKWEYAFYFNDGGTEPIQELNERGEEGWELVTVTPGTDDKYETYYFKRPLVEGR